MDKITLLPSNNKVTSVLKNPFNSKYLKRIHMHLFFETDGSADMRATVEFSNGNTKGSQVFRETTFEELITEIQNFINTL